MSSIDGLRIETAVDQRSGEQHCCLARATPFYVVFHGDQHFSHEHFGVHLGQEDHLTFLGDPGRKFVGSFMDCRLGSPTHGNRVDLPLSCDMRRTLVIPAGVAHAFFGLENIYTINNYALYLPDEDSLLAGGGDWNIEHDVLNVPLGCLPNDVPKLRANQEPASDLLYEILAVSHRDNLKGPPKQYPVIQDVMTADRGHIRLKFVPPNVTTANGGASMWAATVGSSQLVKWMPQIEVASGPGSGIYVMPHFLTTRIFASPFKSLWSDCIPRSNNFRVTLLSAEGLSLTVFNSEEQELLHIPGDGSFYARGTAGCDISVDHPGVHAVVSYEVGNVFS